jgi:hypothetical protein
VSAIARHRVRFALPPLLKFPQILGIHRTRRRHDVQYTRDRAPRVGCTYESERSWACSASRRPLGARNSQNSALVICAGFFYTNLVRTVLLAGAISVN